MKRIATIITVLMLFLASSMAYAGQFGPPEPAAKEGNLSLGVGYFHLSDKWTPDSADWIDAKISANQPYVQASYGFMKNAEAYLRLGAMDLKISPAFFSSTGFSGFKSEFSGESKSFVTAGVKGIFNITSSLSAGPFIQGSLYSDYNDSTNGTIFGFPSSQELKVKHPREINFGASLQSKIRGIVLYAGPFVYWSKADVEGKIIVPGIITATSSTTYKEKNKFGGFAGVRMPLGEKLSLEIEGQIKSEFSAGSSLIYSF